MTEVSGSLKLVTGSPATVSQVWLRAPSGRVQGTEYVTESPDTIQVTGGAVSFDALPGAMVMTLVSHGAPMHTVKLLVPDKTSASLAECIEAAELATDGTRSALERLAFEVRAELGQVPSLVSDALAQDATIIDAVEQASADVLETKADKSVITDATHQVGYADTAHANKLVKLDENGKLYISRHSIVNDSDPVNKIYVDQRAPIESFAGTGSPEGKIAAPVGVVYTDTAATNGAIRWVKTSGTGNTGWRVEYGDTGWRDVTSTIVNRSSPAVFADGAGIHIRRFQGTVQYRIFGDITVASPFGKLTDNFNGFRPKWDSQVEVISRSADLKTGTYQVRIENGVTGQKLCLGGESRLMMWDTEQPWPSTLPGTPV